jgi:hypothetical protein
MKVKLFKHPSIFLATYLNHVQKFSVFPYDFGQILAIEKSKKTHDFRTFNNFT